MLTICVTVGYSAILTFPKFNLTISAYYFAMSHHSAPVKKVLFVCLGNICRSPIAEAVCQHLVKERGVAEQWVIDSAATGPWHIGKSPDSRARGVLKKHSIEYNGRARQLKRDDFDKFDYIFGMDENNIIDINDEAPKNSKAKIMLLGDLDPQGERIIRDPYYDSGAAGFEKCLEQCMRCCTAFITEHS